MHLLKLIVALILIDTGLAQRWLVDEYVPACSCRVLKVIINNTDDPLAKQWLQNLTMTPNDQILCDRWEVPTGDRVMALVDAWGAPTLNFTESVGVKTGDIYFFCGPREIKQKFSFAQLSSGMAGLLFPWLVLLVLLGRQTGARHGDILYVLVSVGSPAWICASIFLGVLYRTAIRKQMAGPLEGYIAARGILETFIQDPAPLHVQSGTLWKLIVMPESLRRRIDAAKIAMADRAKLDMVFVSSLAAAVVVWIFAIIGNFESLLDPFGSPNSVEWQIGNGIIWLWVFAAAYGSTATRPPLASGVVASIISFVGEAEGTDTLTFIADRNRITTGQEPRTDNVLYKESEMPRWWMFNVEVQDGGAVNYGHGFFTASYVSRRIMNDFQAVLPHSLDSPIREDWSDARELANRSNQALPRRSAGTSESTGGGDTIELESQNSSQSNSSQSEIPESASTREESPDETSSSSVRISAIDFDLMAWTPDRNDYVCFVLGHAFGITLQSATIIPAFYLMYFSPPKGIGCISGGILIYGVASMTSWFLSTCSAMAALKARILLQRRSCGENSVKTCCTVHRSLFYAMCFGAIALRVAGKFIAVVNALWILAWSLMTYTNVMRQAWCTTVCLSLGNDGWMPLWNFGPDRHVRKRIVELWCLSASAGVVYCACIIIFLLTADTLGKRIRYLSAIMMLVLFFSVAVPLVHTGIREVHELA